MFCLMKIPKISPKKSLNNWKLRQKSEKPQTSYYQTVKIKKPDNCTSHRVRGLF